MGRASGSAARARRDAEDRAEEEEQEKGARAQTRRVLGFSRERREAVEGYASEVFRHIAMDSDEVLSFLLQSYA